MRNQTSDVWIPHFNVLPLSYRDFTVSKVYYKVLMIHVLHTARISNVGSVMFVNKIREMVSFELGKETGKDVFFLFFLCSTLVKRLKTSFSISLPSSNLTISLIQFSSMTSCLHY